MGDAISSERYLLVEDDGGDADLVRLAVGAGAGGVEVVERVGVALERLAAERFDAVLLDLSLPDATGLDGLRRIHAAAPLLPVIVLTGLDDEALGRRALAEGAQDYLVKAATYGSVLERALRYAIERQQYSERTLQLAEERAARVAAEEALRRVELLVDADKVLAGSLDYDTTARRIAEAAVPRLADWCAFYTVGDGGEVRLEHVGHEGLDVPMATAQAPSERLPAGHPIVEAVRSGRPLLIGRATDADRAAAAVDPARPGLGALGLRSWMVVPLDAGHAIVGVLALATGPSGRSFGGADLALAERFAHQAALVVEKARLYREACEMDRRKDEFLAMLAHELRNPLGAMSNAAQLLRRRGSPDPEVTRAQGVLERQVVHMARLLDDVLDLSRVGRGAIELRRRPVDLGVVANAAAECMESIIEGKELALEVRSTPEPPWIDADPVRIEQVVVNLLHNASKFTPRGGRIAIEIGREGDEAVLRVRDTGEGMTHDELPHVFDRFYQADRSLDRTRGGLGLGLTLVRSLVEMHGGRVAAQSDGPGRGSEFVVRLPALDGAVAPAPAPVAWRAPTVREALRVLVVDDNVDAATMLHDVLESCGYEVAVAYDGLAALEAAAAMRPDAVLLDLGLPGMDGYDVATHLRAHPETAGAALIAVTGYGRPEDRRRSLEVGFDHHLTKPVDVDKLCACIASCREGAAAHSLA